MKQVWVVPFSQGLLLYDLDNTISSRSLFVGGVLELLDWIEYVLSQAVFQIHSSWTRVLRERCSSVQSSQARLILPFLQTLHYSALPEPLYRDRSSTCFDLCEQPLKRENRRCCNYHPRRFRLLFCRYQRQG